MGNYRGDVRSKEANQVAQWIKANNKVTFVDWCPTGFKIGLNDEPPVRVANDDIADSPRNVVMIANNVAVSRVFSQRLVAKFDLMYSQRAFVHWLSVRVWRRVSSPRPARTWASSRRTTWMCSPRAAAMRRPRMRSSKQEAENTSICGLHPSLWYWLLVVMSKLKSA